MEWQILTHSAHTSIFVKEHFVKKLWVELEMAVKVQLKSTEALNIETKYFLKLSLDAFVKLEN